MKLRPSSASVVNIAMIFKLNESQGIFLSTEEEAEILLPDESGNFVIDDVNRTYIVNGDALATPSTSNRIGLPLSYQQSSAGTSSTSRTATNPPPGALLRPRFTQSTVTSTASVSGARKNSQGWKKTFLVVDINSAGNVTEKFQVHLTLIEENATVDGISELLKDQLGFSVTLLDAKYLPIVNNDTTKGKSYINSNIELLSRY